MEQYCLNKCQVCSSGWKYFRSLFACGHVSISLPSMLSLVRTMFYIILLTNYHSFPPPTQYSGFQNISKVENTIPMLDCDLVSV